LISRLSPASFGKAHRSFLVELQLLTGKIVHPAERLRERVAHQFGAGHVGFPQRTIAARLIKA